MLMPRDLPANTPCGMCISTPTADYVFFHTRTSGPHRLQIILHEIGHLLCDHTPSVVLDEETSRILAPDLDPGMIRRMLARTHYMREEEAAAEMIATLIFTEVGHYTRNRTWKVPDEAADVVERIAKSIDKDWR